LSNWPTLRAPSTTSPPDQTRQPDQAQPAVEHDDESEDGAGFIGMICHLARAQFDTIRLLLLKVAALVDQSTRRIHVRMPRNFAAAPVFAARWAKLDKKSLLTAHLCPKACGTPAKPPETVSN
jgi:hypothetical protein